MTSILYYLADGFVIAMGNIDVPEDMTGLGLIGDFQGTIEGAGPWWLWGDGNLHSYIEGGSPPLTLEDRIVILEQLVEQLQEAVFGDS